MIDKACKNASLLDVKAIEILSEMFIEYISKNTCTSASEDNVLK